MKVQEVMTCQTAFCAPDTNLAKAVQIMHDKNCGFLPVVGEGGNVIGVITDRDICIALGTRNQRPADVLVRDVMLPDNRTFPKLYVCTPDNNVHCVMKTMRAEKIHRLPVVDREGALQGVLSIDDILLRACAHPEPQGISCREVIQTMQAIQHNANWPVAA
jgi:CBS domain-containing protein